MLRPPRLTGGNTPGYSDGVAKDAEVGLLVATLVDVATDGFIIGASFAAGGETGTVLAVVRPVELLFLGVAVTSYRIAGWRIVGVTSALGLTVRGFAVLGSAPLTRASLAVLAAPCRSVRPPSSRDRGTPDGGPRGRGKARRDARAVWRLPDLLGNPADGALMMRESTDSGFSQRHPQSWAGAGPVDSLPATGFPIRRVPRKDSGAGLCTLLEAVPW